MTVRELIAELSKYDPGLPVEVDPGGGVYAAWPARVVTEHPETGVPVITL